MTTPLSKLYSSQTTEILAKLENFCSNISVMKDKTSQREKELNNGRRLKCQRFRTGYAGRSHKVQKRLNKLNRNWC